MIGRSHAMLGATGYLSFVTATQIEIGDALLYQATAAAAVLTPVFILIPSGIQAQRKHDTYFRDMVYKFFYRWTALPYLALLLLVAAQWLHRLAPQTIPTHPGWIVAWTACATGWALFSDIDEPSSTISNEFGALSQRVSRFTRKHGGGHRAITHSWITVLAVLLLSLTAVYNPAITGILLAVSFVFAIRVIMPEKAYEQSTPLMLIAAVIAAMITMGMANPWPLVVAAPLGVLLHDLGDWFTRAGIPFWYPYRKKYGTGVTSAGSASEIHFGQPLMIFMILAMLWWNAVLPVVNDPQLFSEQSGLSTYHKLTDIPMLDMKQLLALVQEFGERFT